jgi:hypothetical protein
VKKAAHIFGILLYVTSEKLAEVKTHPVGENPPNLVTLMSE